MKEEIFHMAEIMFRTVFLSNRAFFALFEGLLKIAISGIFCFLNNCGKVLISDFR
jgi:hypothetical protein